MARVSDHPPCASLDAAQYKALVAKAPRAEEMDIPMDHHAKKLSNRSAYWATDVVLWGAACQKYGGQVFSRAGAAPNSQICRPLGQFVELAGLLQVKTLVVGRSLHGYR